MFGFNLEFKSLADALPCNEIDRLNTLHSFDILDTMAEAQYDDLVKIARDLADTPIALLSLVDEKRQWFKSKIGLEVCETHRDLAFCAHAILDPEKPFIIEDTHKDSRFCNSALVTGDPYIRFYAGFPLVTEEGFALGTLCVIDQKPRVLDVNVISTLVALARTCLNLMQANIQKESLEKLFEDRTSDLILAKNHAESANMS
jgi:GAF domain-containing protein